MIKQRLNDARESVELLQHHNDNRAIDTLCDLWAVLDHVMNGETVTTSRRPTIDALESIIEDCNARIKELNAETLAQLEMGLDVPGFKLRAGAVRRTWRDESKVADALAKYNVESPKLYDMKLKGIPAVEKVLTAAGYKPEARQTILAELIDITTGRPSLVKEK